jgi:hypothetical protein
MSDPYEGVREPAPEVAGLSRSIFEPSPLEEVAEAIFVASERESEVYVERFDDRYRWSLVHKGGAYPLLRVTAAFLQMDYHALAIGTRTVAGGYAALAEYPEDEPEPDASAVIALQWGTLPDDAVARIRAAVG